MDASYNIINTIDINDEVILEMIEDEELDDFCDDLVNIDSTDSSDFTDIEESINIIAEIMTMEEIDKLIFKKE
jgi:hypothetical protein